METQAKPRNRNEPNPERPSPRLRSITPAERVNMAWTKQRLETVIRERLGGAKLLVVANREPYIHVREGDAVRCMRPASGMATALDPVMRAAAAFGWPTEAAARIG